MKKEFMKKLAFFLLFFISSIFAPEKIKKVQFKIEEDKCMSLHRAVKLAKIEQVTAILRENPTLIDSLDVSNGWQPIHWAAFLGARGDEILNVLIQHNADVNALTEHYSEKGQHSVLWCALSSHSVGAAAILLRNNVKIDDRDRSNSTLKQALKIIEEEEE